jgi:hypothetical protein
MINLSHIAQKSNLDLKKIRIILFLTAQFICYSQDGVNENTEKYGKGVDFYPDSTYIYVY